LFRQALVNSNTYMSVDERLKRRMKAAAGSLSKTCRLRQFMTLGIALCILVFSASTALAADYRVGQWQAVEIALTSSVIYTDPFQDVDVTATFTGPGNKTIIRPAFWAGGATWKVRFAPPQTGLWTMTTSATDLKNNGLHHVTRTVQCDPYSGNLDIYKHGFLKVSGNGRYFTYADGTPFFYLGDTHWILSHERFNTSNAPGVASQFKYTVDKRVSQGFTVFQSEAGWQARSAQIRITDEARADEEADADLKDGFTSADLAGFANLDRKFKYIADEGLVHANAEICWAGDPAGFPIFTEAYMARLAKYWVARYGAYPVIWTIAQEIDKNFYGAYDATTINRWFAEAQSIAVNDAYHHPVMPHMENTDHTTASKSWWSGKPYHSGWAVQWQGELTDMGTAKGFWNALPAKPSVLYESAYDSFWTDSRGALGAAYKAFQYGMYGYGYGANGLWNDIYSKPGEPGDFGTAYEMPAHYFWWRDGADLRTGDQLAYFKHFYTSLKWWRLIPRFNDSASGSFADASRSLLSSDGEGTYVVFFFGAGTSTGTLNQMENQSTYVAQWFNPRNGQFESVGTFTQNGSQWVIPARPSAEDWVLLVRKTGASTR
jgi:uncharacterized protein DUF4038/uncharacterized protein DUF5060/collagenase-like protein with putative collagen-binding domain